VVTFVVGDWFVIKSSGGGGALFIVEKNEEDEMEERKREEVCSSDHKLNIKDEFINGFKFVGNFI